MLVCWFSYFMKYRELKSRTFWYLVYVISWNKVLTHCEFEIIRVEAVSIVKWNEIKNDPQILVHLLSCNSQWKPSFKNHTYRLRLDFGSALFLFLSFSDHYWQTEFSCLIKFPSIDLTLKSNDSQGIMSYVIMKVRGTIERFTATFTDSISWKNKKKTTATKKAKPTVLELCLGA